MTHIIGVREHDLVRLQDYLRKVHYGYFTGPDPMKLIKEDAGQMWALVGGLLEQASDNSVTETYPVVGGVALRLSFTPQAIREHYGDGEWEGLEGLSDKDLLMVGSYALSDDNLYQAFRDALTAAIEAVRTEEELDPVGQMGWQRALSIADDVLPGETRDGQAGGTVIVRTYLPDGRNVIISDGDSGGEPFSGDETAGLLYVGLYESTDAADEGADAVLFMPEVPATERHLTDALLNITGLPAHLCDQECGDPTHPHDGLLTKET